MQHVVYIQSFDMIVLCTVFKGGFTLRKKKSIQEKGMILLLKFAKMS